MDLYLYRADEQTGPYTEADARALVASGQITRTCLAWHEGMAEWQPLEEIVALPKPPAPLPVTSGLPPVPTRPNLQATAYTVQAHKPPPAAPARSVKFWPWINTYGVAVIGFAVFLLRWLSGCHHQ